MYIPSGKYSQYTNFIMNPQLILSSLLMAGARRAILDPEVILGVKATHREQARRSLGPKCCAIH